MVYKLHNMRTVLLLLFVGSSSILFAQKGVLTLQGRVENQKVRIPNVVIEVYKDNELFLTDSTERNGVYKVDLDLGSVYNVSFKKKGYVRKSIAVVGQSEKIEQGRYFFQLDIELFRLDQEGLDHSVLPPAAMLYLVDDKTGFAYDKRYVKWISGEYRDLDD
ncbi:MAG: hypothetical protein CMO34_01000 [Verrucomicrobia bacterium]|nr:hypothetical protein [Verrucomicrobiota bacterium]